MISTNQIESINCIISDEISVPASQVSLLHGSVLHSDVFDGAGSGVLDGIGIGPSWLGLLPLVVVKVLHPWVDSVLSSRGRVRILVLGIVGSNLILDH